MPYRLIALVLIAAIALFASLDNLTVIASLTSQAARWSKAQEHEAVTRPDDTDFKIENESIQTSSNDEDSEDSLILVSTQDHTTLSEASSIAATNMQPNSVWINEQPSLYTELTPVIAAHEATIVIAEPIYNSQPAFSGTMTCNGNQCTNVAVADHYVDPYAAPNVNHYTDNYINQSVDNYNVQSTNHYIDPYAYQNTDHYVDQNVIYHLNQPAYQSTYRPAVAVGTPTHRALNTENYSLLQYRLIMINSPAPDPFELQGMWRGVNKGIATVAIDKRFIKDFQNVNGQIYGDNIDVRQGNRSWETIQDRRTGSVKRQGKFLVQRPSGSGPFRHGVFLNYSKGGNRKLDPANLISDRLVKLDDNHMLGRATVKLGPIRIPLAYFVLQRVTQ